MKAYLIDPEFRRVSIVDLIGKTTRERLDEMRRLIRCDGMDHVTVSDEHDSLWVDDRGLLRGQPVYAFRLRIMHDPLAGKAVMIGADDEGHAKPPYFPLDLLKREVIWLGLIVPQVDWVEDGNVMRAVVTYARPKS